MHSRTHSAAQLTRADSRAQDTKTLPVTPRTLETLIRLATAHAKCRLARRVELDDARAACRLMGFALYNELDGNGAGASGLFDGADDEVVDSGRSPSDAGPISNNNNSSGDADGDVERNAQDKRPAPDGTIGLIARFCCVS